MHEWRAWLVALAVAGSAGVGRLAAQESGRRVYDEQLRVKLDEQVPEARDVGPDAGGWFSFALFKYDDQAGRRFRTLRQYELRGWGSFNIRGEHRFYIRGVTGYDDWNDGDNPTAWRQDEFKDPKVERVWYQFDLGQMLRNQTGRRPDVDFRFKVGREFATIGSALVLSMPLDMVQFDASAGDWHLEALLGKTLYDTTNIDDSFLVQDHQRRCLWGLELSYTGISHHRPYAYFLENQDRTKPSVWDPRQAYDYSSRYLGLGCDGTVLLPDLHYRAEYVREWGNTFSEGVTSGRDAIAASALDVLLEYYFQVRTHPRVTAEYLYASGDDDRRLSATSTVGGNAPDTFDHAFNAFGFRDTGLAFSPRLSNLHVYVVGAGFFPLEQFELFRKMEVGTKAFFYHKAVGDGPISDLTATNQSRWLGWEWDVYCDWRLTSDLSWTIRYGAFQPGAAFDDKSCRQFLYTGITYSF